SEMAKAVLAPDLAELAGPIGKNSGKAGVRQVRVVGMAAAVEAAANRPAAIHAVFAVGIEAECMLGLENVCRGELIASAPEKLAAQQKRVIDGAAKGLPAQSGVGAVEIGEEVRRIESGANAGVVVATSVGDAEIEIGGFVEIAIGTEMADDAEV